MCIRDRIHWWHALTGANNDVVVKLATDFNASQKAYKVVPLSLIHI